MKKDFLALFIDSHGLARVLRAFVFDHSNVFTLSQIARRAGVTLPTAELEVKELTRLGIIKGRSISLTPPSPKGRGSSSARKTEKIWFLDPTFKHARALSAFVHEVSPPEYDIVLDALKSSGKLSVVILSGTFLGDASRPVDLLVAGDGMSDTRVEHAVKKLEPVFGREIRYATFSTSEFRYRLTIQDRLMRDTLDFPHTVLLDRSSLL